MNFDHSMVCQRRSQIGLSLFFVFSLLLILAGSFVELDSMPNFHERRRLAALPSFGKNISIHDFPSAFTKFAADNFGFRKPLLSIYFKFRLNLLHADLGLPAVLGGDGWLFSDQEIPTFRHQDLLTPVQAERIRNKLDAWCEYSHQKGAEFVFFVAPNKSTIYPEKMPSKLRLFRDNPSLLDQVNALDFHCRFEKVDLRDTLLKNRDEYLYYRWGTHWNERAAQLAWDHIKEAIGATVSNLRWPAVQSTISYRPAQPLEDSMWTWFGHHDPYSVMVPRITITALPGAEAFVQEHPRQAKILVYGDSFMHPMLRTAHIVANEYSSFVLKQGGKLSDHTSELSQDSWLVAVIGRGEQRNPEFVDVLKPNLVMHEVVERDILSISELPVPRE